VIVEDYQGCTGSDTVAVEVADTVALADDTFICEGDVFTINAGYGFDSYEWNDVPGSQVLEVSTGGTYYVDVAYNFGCPSSDTIIIDWYPLPVSNLGDDLGVCEGSTVELAGPDGDYEYYWNGILGEQVYVVTEEGNYELKVMNFCGEAVDDIDIELYPLPIVDLGDDGLLYPGEDTQLDAGEQTQATYLWQDGSTGRYYLVNYDDPAEDNLYWVEVKDANSCVNADSIYIEVFDIFIPIVITPNGDGDNDRFEPDPDRWNGINDHTMTVFNRWGEKVWETNDFESGWDGKKNGKYVAEGAYFWVLEVSVGPENLKKSYKGSLTVMGIK